MSDFLKAVKAAHEQHQRTAAHQQALAWQAQARVRLAQASTRKAA